MAESVMHRRKSAPFVPQKAAGQTHQPEITDFPQREASVDLICAIKFDRNRLGGLAGHPKWEMSAQGILYFY